MRGQVDLPRPERRRHYDATFAATGLAEFGPASPTVTLLGKGDENGVTVDLRITHPARTCVVLTMLRESRRPARIGCFGTATR